MRDLTLLAVLVRTRVSSHLIICIFALIKFALNYLTKYGL